MKKLPIQLIYILWMYFMDVVMFVLICLYCNRELQIFMKLQDYVGNKSVKKCLIIFHINRYFIFLSRCHIKHCTYYMYINNCLSS